VAGGRNIADEYFMRNATQNFVYMDAFIVGAVVADMASIFDRYWNSEVVYPVESIVGDTRPAEALRGAFDAALDAAEPSPPIELPPVDVLGYGPIREDLDAGRLGLVWGPARAISDPPDKLLKKTADEAIASSVTNDVRMVIWNASKEVVLTSPYLIPGEKGLRSIEELRERGVAVTVLTNSLAATDEPLVHTGYSRYRYQMLQAGVDVYELSPVRTRATKRLGMFGPSLGRLHAKTAVVDRRMVFIGSMNLDPRSASQNTELGVFVDSPQLAKELLRVINISKLQSAYRLRLQPDGPGIQWLATDEDKEIVLGVEPESTPLLRLHNIVFGLFVPEQLL
jgi:putative cardiolipin synthase